MIASAELDQIAREAKTLEHEVRRHKSEVWRNRRQLREKKERLEKLRALLSTAGVDVQTIGEDRGDCHGQRSPSTIDN